MAYKRKVWRVAKKLVFSLIFFKYLSLKITIWWHDPRWGQVGVELERKKASCFFYANEMKINMLDINGVAFLLSPPSPQKKGDKKTIKNRLVLFFARWEPSGGRGPKKMVEKAGRKKATTRQGRPINDREIVANAKFAVRPERLKLKAASFDTTPSPPPARPLNRLTFLFITQAANCCGISFRVLTKMNQILINTRMHYRWLRFNWGGGVSIQ